MDGVLNWLWQGIVVTALLFAMLGLLARARANVRYAVCWGALLLVVALPVMPWIVASVVGPVAIPAPTTAAAVVVVPDAWWTSSLVVAAAWMMWAAVGTLRFLRAMLALRRARADAAVFPGGVESTLRHWVAVRDRGRRAVLATSDSVTTAAVLGWGPPVIAVAPSLLTTLDADELDRILIHEWAHVQRRDDLANMVQVAVRIVAGWHPAVWWIDRRLHLEREIACDETTVTIGGAPKAYAACLLKLATLEGPERTMLAAPAVLRASGLRTRLTRIVSHHPFIPSGWSRGLGTGLVSTLCAASLMVGELKLVGETMMALPFDSIPVLGARFESRPPVPTPPELLAAPPTARAVATAASETAAPVAAQEPAIVAPQPVVLPDAPAVVEHQDASSGARATSEPTPLPAVIVKVLPATAEHSLPPAAPVVEQSTPPAFPDEHADGTLADGDRPPWVTAAEHGTEIGRKSKEAGVATAGFFRRFVRQVGGSF